MHILTGSVQCVVLAALPLFIKKRLPNQIFLPILLLTYSLNNLNDVFFYMTFQANTSLNDLPFSFFFQPEPHYLHIKFALSLDTPWEKKQYLYFYR